MHKALLRVSMSKSRIRCSGSATCGRHRCGGRALRGPPGTCFGISLAPPSTSLRPHPPLWPSNPPRTPPRGAPFRGESAYVRRTSKQHIAADYLLGLGDSAPHGETSPPCRSHARQIVPFCGFRFGPGVARSLSPLTTFHSGDSSLMETSFARLWCRGFCDGFLYGVCVLCSVSVRLCPRERFSVQGLPIAFCGSWNCFNSESGCVFEFVWVSLFRSCSFSVRIYWFFFQ